MNFDIRLASENDMEDVLSLIKELAVFEKEPKAVVIQSTDLIKHAFSKPPLFVCFVAVYQKKNSWYVFGLFKIFHLERSYHAFRGFNCYTKI